jgi:quinol-cytochrome oxidoreductase complex cytochrome b subunit
MLVEALRGGSDIGSSTLVIFHSFHTTLIPTVLVGLMGYHFWRVRKARGVVLPRPANRETDGTVQDESVSAWPHLLIRELACGLALIAVVLMLAVFMDAPLGPAANPGMSPNPAKAPWYFVGFQELQLHFHPMFAVVIIPLMMTAALIFVPYLRYETEPSGPWFLTAVGRRTALLAAGVSLVLTPMLIVADELWLLPGAGLPSIFARGFLPLAVVVAFVFGFRTILVKGFSASKAEVVQAVFTAFFVSLAVLTATGVWCRGANMALVWPGGL